MNPTIVLYEGRLFVETTRCRSSVKKLHKVNVILKRCRSTSKYGCYKLITGAKVFTFTPDDALFFDKEETEKNTFNANTLLECWKSKTDLYKRHRKFITVMPLVFIDRKFEYTNPRPVQTLCKFKGVRNEIDKLYHVLVKEFGIIRNWFVDVENNGREHNRRLTVSKQNICLLDESLYPVKYYMFNDIEFTATFDEASSELNVEIMKRYGDPLKNASYVCDRIQLITEAGRDIKTFIDGMVVQEHSYESSKGSTMSLEKRVQNWLRDQSSNAVHNSTFESFMLPPVVEILESFDDEIVIKSLELPNCPPPPPCGEEAVHCPPLPCPSFKRKLKLPKPQRKPPKGHMLRSESCANISYCNQTFSDEKIHYANCRDPVACDDSNYSYRFYYNFGHVKRRTEMKFRIERVNRLSDSLDNVSLEVIPQHEKWYDEHFQSRDDDETFKRLMSNIYAYASVMNITSPEKTTDDHYWSSDLCLTIHRMIEQKKQDLHRVFDITWAQYVGLVVCLDLQLQRGNDWIEFASWIGIKSFRDIEIIKHFCYTYKIMAMDVVLSHWYLQEQKGRNVPKCSFDQLRNIIIQIERKDILQILNDPNMNQDEDELSDDDNTHL